MSKAALKTPPDQLQRDQALDPARSILVQAPAGSGKTTLLTERFLTLLAEVDDPGQVVAITFTNAAAAEMRNRVLDSLRTAELNDANASPAARRALQHAELLGWKLLDLPAQLRIMTIDSFCRELALQQPLLSGFGGGLAIAEQPGDLYRRAARHTLEEIGKRGDPAVGEAVEALLVWRDNNWQELEDLLVQMLAGRARWMQEFVLTRAVDWETLRERLERPFANAMRTGLEAVSELLDQALGAREEALQLARFACRQECGEQHRALAELVEFPGAPFMKPNQLDEAQQALLCLGNLVQTGGGTFRQRIDKNLGFPPDRKAEKSRLTNLIADLRNVDGLEAALAQVRNLPPARYTEDDWEIVKACFTLLRHAAGQLKVVFAEAAAMDFTEVAQIAEAVLKGDDGNPSDAAIAVADKIRHLLVDEFQDTSRRQHQLLAGLIAAWPDRSGRTLFAVGDPMQSIYFFREADAELFGRVRELGLELANGETLQLGFVPLSANFRTAPRLVDRLNEIFGLVFAEDDGSGVSFSPAEAARGRDGKGNLDLELHLRFAPQATNKIQVIAQAPSESDDPAAQQLKDILEVIHSHQSAIDAAKLAGEKYRVSVLGRARKSLIPIAAALREARIPYRAVDLEQLGERPEVLDALALGRALLNAQDRVAWLGVLRAPWCGLGLLDFHAAAGGDDPELLPQPVPALIQNRLPLLSEVGRTAVERVLTAVGSAAEIRITRPTASLGTWLEQVWLRLGGPDCYDRTARANLDLLWRCLDKLPEGETDLLGPALDAALKKLTALPDPEASGDVGVQLMTIHKSKGLEFEVVIVPDLQARTAGGGKKLLAWLERGLEPDNASEEDAITEFLIAPLQTRGEDAGASKRWVDRVYREREEQETRRLLYVAATRAREELHLFARPNCRMDANGDWTLLEPSIGLLKTAWPGLETEIRQQFETWKTTLTPQAEVLDLAASAGSNNLVVMPPSSVPRPALLLRLPEGYVVPASSSVAPAKAQISGLGDGQLYARHEGGLASRALGTAVHVLLEELARLRAKGDWEPARTGLSQLEGRIAAQVRGMGIAGTEASRIAQEALKLADSASRDAQGQWILSPYPEAANEVSWNGTGGTGTDNGPLSTVRVDRVFRAGPEPMADGSNVWWIIDYKTAQAGDVAELRPLFAAQLEAYARALRSLHGAHSVVRAGLFYPRVPWLDWWEI